MIKKILSLMLCLTLLMSSVGFVSASDNTGEQIYDQHSSVLLLEKFLEKYDASEYGGAFIDDDGHLVIRLLPSDNAEQIEYIYSIQVGNDDLNGSIVECQTAQHSLKYLVDIVDILTPHLVDLGVLGAGTDEKNNCVVIDAPTSDTESIASIRTGVMNILSDAGLDVDDSTIAINECEGLSVQATSTYNPGSSINGAYTLGWGATLEYGTYSGQTVFLVPGHAVSLGSTISFGTTTIGSVIARQFGGLYDFAYVLNSNGHSVSSTLPNGTTLPLGAYASPPQGLSVTAYGATSHLQTGTILLTNYSDTVNGTALTGMFKTSYKAVVGDSGAPVWNGSAIGMQSTSALSSTGAWVSGSSYSICTSIYRLCVRGSAYDIYLSTF
jgi:hypothetical protein